MRTLFLATILTALAAQALDFAPASAETPLRQPQLASGDGMVVLAYGAGQVLFAAVSTDRGRTFRPPVRIATAHVLPLGRHRGPRVVIAQGQIIVTAVSGHQLADGPHAHGLPADGDLLAWRSSDQGRTWSQPVRVNDLPSASREGLHSLAADAHGRLFATWLDLREKGTRLFGAFSDDRGATWSRNTPLYASPGGTICECCHPSAAFLPDGAAAVMFRNNLKGSRDFYLLSTSKGAKPEKLGVGTWKINACPMDGGAVSVSGSSVLTAWRREESVYLAERGKPEQLLGHGKDIAMTRAGARTLAVWVDGTAVTLWDNGASTTLADAGGFPAIIALPDASALIAWENKAGGLTLHIAGDSRP